MFWLETSPVAVDDSTSLLNYELDWQRNCTNESTNNKSIMLLAVNLLTREAFLLLPKRDGGGRKAEKR